MNTHQSKKEESHITDAILYAMTAKKQPAMKRVECKGVGDNDGFYEMIVPSIL